MYIVEQLHAEFIRKTFHSSHQLVDASLENIKEKLQRKKTLV